MKWILIVEDEGRVAGFLSRGLRAEGCTAEIAGDGRAALRLAEVAGFDAILLDLMLPGLSGLEVCQELRARSDLTPVLMLTALDGVEDKVQGLRMGADDYLVKPFAFDELLARLAALIRRNRNFGVPAARLVVGDLVFDRGSLTVTRAGRRIELTATELALLELLMSTPGKVFSRARILSAVWGYTSDPLTNVVDVYIRRLRKKLDVEEAMITTVRGHGYRIEPSGEPVR